MNDIKGLLYRWQRDKVNDGLHRRMNQLQQRVEETQ